MLTDEPLITLWLRRVRERALTDMLNGAEIPGYKVVAGRSSREWSDESAVEKILKNYNYPEDKYTKTETLSVAQMEKSIGKKVVEELVGGLISVKTGSPTIAPETDKRPVYDRVAEAKKDFE